MSSSDIFGCIFLLVIFLSVIAMDFLLPILPDRILYFLFRNASNFPSLTYLCSQLKDDFLSATASSCPLIESLVLMSCPSVGPDGLSSLHCLLHLTYLDLSYTFLVNLQPVFDSCLYLKVLYCICIPRPSFCQMNY